ncbi:MAG: hypothetical protein AAB486_02730 [Patescibacteria group bacterium]
MRRAGRITADEFLKGIRFARSCSSRTEAEKSAANFLEILGKHPEHAPEYQRAVGHLARHRLIVGVEDFSRLFVKLLMDACITVAEAQLILKFSASDYRAGALELVKLFQEGKISRNEVHLAFTAAVTAKSQGEAERFAQQLLFQNRLEGFSDATPLEYSFCATCLYLVGEWSGLAARDQMIVEIKGAVETEEDQRVTTPASTVTFNPDMPRPMVVKMVDGQLWYFSKPDLNQYRDVAVSFVGAGMDIFPSARATIIGSTEEENVSFPPSNHIVRIGERMVLVPLVQNTRYWITTIVQKVEIL